MKTLKELKNQKELNVRKISCGLNQQQKIQNVIKQLQPEQYVGEYARKNDFKVEVNGNNVKFTCETLYSFFILPDIAINEIKEYIARDNNLSIDAIEVEKIEKINRYLITIKNYVLNKEISPDETKTEMGKIRFRSNDYIFIKEDGGESLGSQLKSENLIKDENGNITGFYMMTFNDTKIIYEFC